MLSKKMLCFALGVGVGAGVAYYATNNKNTVDQKLRCVKRKMRKLEKDISNTLKKLRPEEMQKYKTELETKYKEIKDKVDNLTIKDIKDSAQNAINTIKQNITTLSDKVSSLMTSSGNNQN